MIYFNCFGDVSAIIFPSLLILFLILDAKRTFVFRKRISGSELISIYRDYFIIITSFKKYFELNETYRWRKRLLVVTKNMD